MLVIAVCGLKGGVGKTTTAAGIGLHAQLDGNKVVMIDADPQHSLWAWLTMHDADELTVRTLSTKQHKREMERLCEGADVVVIDTPPGVTDTSITLAALAVADMAVLPVTPSALDVDRFVETLKAASAVCDTVAALVVRTDTRWRFHRQLVEVLEEMGDVALLDASVPDRQEIAGAAMGPPSESLAAYEPVWHELREFAK